jgi:hypothetical protein
MPNTQTSVPAFTAGQVLTAAQMTEVNTGIPVFATTVTRDAAFGGTGEKTLAEGQFAYIEATNTTQYYDGSAWQPVGVTPALVLVKTQTIGSAVSSVQITDAFNSTYDNYRVVVSDVDYSTGGQTTKMTFGATATGYYGSWYYDNYDGAGTGTLRSNNAAFFYACQSDTENGGNFAMDIFSPNLAKRTTVSGQGYGGATSFWFSAAVFNTTQYTAFTLTTGGGTMTGGTVRVYGYQNS